MGVYPLSFIDPSGAEPKLKYELGLSRLKNEKSSAALFILKKNKEKFSKIFWLYLGPGNHYKNRPKII